MPFLKKEKKKKKIPKVPLTFWQLACPEFYIVVVIDGLNESVTQNRKQLYEIEFIELNWFELNWIENCKLKLKIMKLYKFDCFCISRCSCDMSCVFFSVVCFYLYTYKYLIIEKKTKKKEF